MRRLCLALMTSLLVAGCTTQAPWVDCERKLEPINLPASKAKWLPPPPALVPAAKRESGS